MTDDYSHLPPVMARVCRTLERLAENAKHGELVSLTRIDEARAALAAARQYRDWTPIEQIPEEWKDGRQVQLRGDKGPYGVTSWEAVARWGTPKNWHKDWATWMDGPTPNHAVLRLAGYIPTHARLLPPPPPKEPSHD